MSVVGQPKMCPEIAHGSLLTTTVVKCLCFIEGGIEYWVLGVHKAMTIKALGLEVGFPGGTSSVALCTIRSSTRLGFVAMLRELNEINLLAQGSA